MVTTTPPTDRFENKITGDVPYARGDILSSVEADYQEVTKARRIIRDRIEQDGYDAIFNFSGLERGLPITSPDKMAESDPKLAITSLDDIEALDDELAPALYGDQFREQAVEHFGGSAPRHDTFLANRLTAATISTFRTLVESGDTVIGIAPSHSHASVVRAANQVDATLVETSSVEEFRDALDTEEGVSLVVLTRMDVTYENFEEGEVEAIIEAAKDANMTVYMDDAGGARVAPAVLDHPKSLETGVDIVGTGLDKYGVNGPRFGLLSGNAAMVEKIRTTAWKFGLEARPTCLIPALHSLQQYDPQKVRDAVDATKEVGNTIESIRGESIHETPTIVKLLGEDILEMALDEAGIDENDSPIVPFEATAAISMLMLRDYGCMTVHFAGIPSGTGDFLLKFIPPNTLERFGGADAFAEAVDTTISDLAELLNDPDEIRALLLE